MQQIYGNELKVGDTLKVWWGANTDTITNLTPYTGPLVEMFKDGAQTASFALNWRGMTIDNGNLYEVVSRISNA